MHVEQAYILIKKKKNYKYNKLFIYKSNIKIIRLENIFFFFKKKVPPRDKIQFMCNIQEENYF